MDIFNAVGIDDTYGIYVDDECFDSHDYDDDTDDDTDETMILTIILMMILMMMLMMVSAGTCTPSKFPGGRFVHLKSAPGLNLWPEQ